MTNQTIETIFIACLFIAFYAYLGYGVFLYLLIRLKRIFFNPKYPFDENFIPTVTFVVPCFNEQDTVADKIKNCLALDYPSGKLEILFITDGSTDGTPEIISKYPNVKLLHESPRKGKASAENRAMGFVNTDITIFSDANTSLPSNAVKLLVRHYIDPKVGGVSGEKRVLSKVEDSAAGAGEGIYWKYESLLKKWDSELWSIVGAAGELFSFRTKLFQPIEVDSILDDFMLSMRIAQKGFRVLYEPDAYAAETASASVKEELKRKVRICAGGWQSILWLLPILLPFKNPTLTFQYISHRVLRWTIVPFLLILALPLNFLLLEYHAPLYQILFIGQLLFYVLAVIGWFLETKKIKVKIVFVPYYFCLMNYAVLAGALRFLRKKQSSAWERSKRA